MPPRRSGGAAVVATGATGCRGRLGCRRWRRCGGHRLRGHRFRGHRFGGHWLGGDWLGGHRLAGGRRRGGRLGPDRVRRRSYGLGWWGGFRGRSRCGLGLARGCFVAHESDLTDRGDSAVIVTPRA